MRSYKATIGESVITTPHINIIQTKNTNLQVAFELGLPENINNNLRFVPAGSRFEAVVEYVVLPAVKSMYYGYMSYLVNMPTATFENSTEFIMDQARGHAVSVVATIGGVRCVQVNSGGVRVWG